MLLSARQDNIHTSIHTTCIPLEWPGNFWEMTNKKNGPPKWATRRERDRKSAKPRR